MVYTGPGPRKGIYIMTIGTISRIIALRMAGLGGSLIIGLMAIVAFHSQRIKPQQRSRRSRRS